VERERIYEPEGERAVLYCDDTCGPIRRSAFTWYFKGELIDLRRSSNSRYFHLAPFNLTCVSLKHAPFLRCRSSLNKLLQYIYEVGKATDIAHGNPISELRDVTCQCCHMGSHSVTCHPTQVNAPRLTLAMQAGTRFTYPGGRRDGRLS